MKTLAVIVLALATGMGCAAKAQATRTPVREGNDVARSSAAAATTRPILYHRTGGIAGTNDRLVVWPDGFVQVDGKLFNSAVTRLTDERYAKIRALFDGWDTLKSAYLTNNIPDAYTITINYGDKAVVASDLAPDLPQKFRDIFTELEAVAADAQQQQDRTGGSEEVKP